MDFRSGLAAALALTAMMLAGITPLSARECRIVADAPPGVRMPPQVGCQPVRATAAKTQQPPNLRAGREPGFIDLGNGTELRIGGRMRAESVVHR
jgi:hypothetical protein